MNWQNFIKGLLLSTLVFGLVLFLMTLLLDPAEGLIVIGIYYFSIFIFLGGILTAIGFFARRWWRHNEVVFENIKVSIRQGYLVSLVICFLLALSSMRLLTWWDGAIVVMSALLIELYFKTRV